MRSGEAPLQQKSANDAAYSNQFVRAEAIRWLNGLHHSYRRAA